MLDRSSIVQGTKEAAIYNGTEFSRLEIAIAIVQLIERAKLLDANLKTLNENFTARRMADIKQASENIASVAGDAKKLALQIEGQSAHLAGVFTTHLNRRSRA